MLEARQSDRILYRKALSVARPLFLHTLLHPKHSLQQTMEVQKMLLAHVAKLLIDVLRGQVVVGCRQGQTLSAGAASERFAWLSNAVATPCPRADKSTSRSSSSQMGRIASVLEEGMRCMNPIASRPFQARKYRPQDCLKRSRMNGRRALPLDPRYRKPDTRHKAARAPSNPRSTQLLS